MDESRRLSSNEKGPSAALLLHASPDEIPQSDEILSPDALELALPERRDLYSLLFLGDIMLGDRAAKRIQNFGVDYPFAGIAPLLHRCQVVVGNLEAPFTTAPLHGEGRFAYRVDPASVVALNTAGISAVNLANNHLMDCGRDGVRQTLATLDAARIGRFGAGINEATASEPFIVDVDGLRVGLLGYYWNSKCTATATLPGCALDTPDVLRTQIPELRRRVDRVIVSFHWGSTYVREVAGATMEKARFAIDCGADAVIGHHPHVVQRMEIHQGRPIFYSLGNAMMGSGNSKAQGIAVAMKFMPDKIQIDVYSLYVKNRDGRVNYQTKLLRGGAAQRILDELSMQSASSVPKWTFDGLRNSISIPLDHSSTAW